MPTCVAISAQTTLLKGFEGCAPTLVCEQTFCESVNSLYALSTKVHFASHSLSCVAPHMHGQLRVVLVGGATFQWLK